MANKIEVFGKIGDTIQARLLFPRKVEVAITPAPGDDPAKLLREAFDRLAPDYATKPENPADDPPVSVQPALTTFDGQQWAGNLALAGNPIPLDTPGEEA